MTNQHTLTATSASYMMLATGSQPSQQILLGAGVLPDEPLRELLLQAGFAWNALDYMLRMSLKRLRRLSIDDAESVRIMALPSHGHVIAELLSDLRRTADIRLSAVETLERVIGGRKDKGSLYDRRNQAIHSIFAHTKDGPAIFRRIGHADYSAPSPIEPSFLQQLVAEIGDTIDRFDTLFPA